MAPPAVLPHPGVSAAPLAFQPPQARLRMLLNSGGDERLWIDPHTGANRYGVPDAPAPDELWFSSSTASAVSPRGSNAAGAALGRLTADPASADPADWMDGLRRRLLALYGVPGAQAVLCASGTEAELIVLALARNLMPGATANLVVAPCETGRGVPLAAAGRHFLATTPLGGGRAPGDRLAGWDDAAITVQPVEIRTPAGVAIAPDVIDAAAAKLARQALAADQSVLLHLLDQSKTGLDGVSRLAALSIASLDLDRVLVVVDACQLRCDAAAVRADLTAGFAVMITGSKFAGGPPFAGALLLPPAWLDRLDGLNIPPGLADYSARLDWPVPLRAAVAPALAWPVNLGLGLRWTAALAEIEAYEALAPQIRRDIQGRFAAAVLARAAVTPGLRALTEVSDATIIPILCGLPPAATRRLWAYLAQPCEDGPACHLGQPVAVGQDTALRVCASMPLVNDVAQRLGEGASLEAAMQPVYADLDRLFARWDFALNGT